MADAPARIGEYLIRIGVITEEQVQEVLDAQAAGDSRLFGDIAVEYGYINDEVLQKYIEAKAAWDK